MQVLTTDGQWVTGRILDVSGSVISLLVLEQARRDIARDRVWEVWQPASRSGALKGLAVGAAVMLGLGALAWSADECRQPDSACAPDEELTGGDVALMGAVGATVGAVIGRAVLPPHEAELLYARPSSTAAAAGHVASRGATVRGFTVRF